MTKGSLTILSCGLGVLPPGEEDTVRNAEIMYGAQRLLSLAANMAGKADCRPIAANARIDAQNALRLAQEGRRVVVLASGDALFHGMGGVLAKLVAEQAESNPPPDQPEIRFVPGVTAFQALFHRLGLAWDEARIFSAHHAEALPLRAMLATPLAVIYTGSRHSVPQLAARLIAVQPQAALRPALLADSLGMANERLVLDTLTELAHETAGPTAMLLLLPYAAAPPILPLGLPVDCFEREAGLITAPEVRAVILSRLRLPAWGDLWDIGAGSGSIGLEAAGLCPNLTVTAVERHPGRAGMIRRNAERLGLANHRTVEGGFLDVLEAAPALPAPQRIVVGGGGADLEPILNACMEHLVPGGIMVVSAVTLESLHRLYGWRPELRSGLLTVQISEEHPLAGSYHHLEPQRTIHLYCYTKPETPKGHP